MTTGNSPPPSWWHQQYQALDNLQTRLKAIAQTLELELATSGALNTPALRETFLDIIGETFAVMVDQFAKEQSLFRLLRNTPEAQAYSEAHKRDHADISERISLIAAHLDDQELSESIQKLSAVLSYWLDAHASEFDAKLREFLAADA